MRKTNEKGNIKKIKGVFRFESLKKALFFFIFVFNLAIALLTKGKLTLNKINSPLFANTTKRERKVGPLKAVYKFFALLSRGIAKNLGLNTILDTRWESANKKSLIEKIKSNLQIYKVITLLTLVWLMASFAFAVPNTLTFSGRLTDASGNALTGTYSFNYSIYDSYVNGTLLWNKTNISVTTDSDGIYDVVLENVNLNFSDQYYVGMTVGSDSEMTPRTNLTSVPYTFRANISDSVKDESISNKSIDSSGDFSFDNIFFTSAYGDNVSITGNLSVIGNVSVDGTTLFVDAESNRVGIGITSPNDALEVIGNVRVSGSLNASNLNTTGQTILAYESGNVGIGQTSPNVTLGVSGDANITGTLYLGSGFAQAEADGWKLSNFTSAYGTEYDSTGYKEGNLSSDLSTGVASTIVTTDITADTILVNKNLYVVGNISNVNVTNLNVNGSLYPAITATFDVGNGSLRWRNANFSGDMEIGGDLVVDGSTLHIDSSGSKVGIGTTSPDSKLHVEGNVTIGGTELYFEDATTGGNPSIIRTIHFNNNDDLVYDDTLNQYKFSGDNVDYMVIDNGNVGIGTKTPQTNLHINRTTGSGETLIVENTGPSGYIEFRENTTVRGYFGFSDAGVFTGGTTNSMNLRAQGNLHFGANGDNLAMTINNGNVGIGQTSPNVTLGVSGDVNVTGTLYLGSGFAQAEADGWKLSNFTGAYGTEYDSTGFDRENLTVYLGADGNASLLRTGNMSNIRKDNWDWLNNASLVLDNGTVIRTGNLSTIFSERNGSLWNVSGSDIFPRELSGNVGIGTTSPNSKLTVIGDVNITGSLNVSGNLTFPQLKSCDTIDTDANGVLTCGSDGGGTSGTINSTAWNRTGTNVLLAEQSDSIGIGTDTPDTKLHVIGNVTINDSVSDGAIQIDSTNDVIRFTGENGSMYQPVYGTDDDLVLYLPFSENVINVSNTTYDRSPYGNDGTLGNMNTGNATKNGSAWVSGKYGYAMEFDGMDDYVDCGTDASLFPVDELTIEAWIKGSAWSATETNGARIYDDSYRMLNVLSTGKVRFSRFGSSGWGPVDSVTVLNTDQWYHVAGVYDGTNIMTYIDGILDNSTSQSFTSYFDGSCLAFIGGQHSKVADCWFNGTIDEVKIYKRALTAEEIRTHYLRGSGYGAMGAITANEFRIVNTSGNVDFIKASSGNIGIGTTAPGQELHVVGNANVSTTLNAPVINTTLASQNITISSSGGSVIIRLG